MKKILIPVESITLKRGLFWVRYGKYIYTAQVRYQLLDNVATERAHQTYYKISVMKKRGLFLCVWCVALGDFCATVSYVSLVL